VASSESPRVFRLLLPARELRKSRRFYETLLATKGRGVTGGRVYFDSGPVILGILDCSSVPASEFRPASEAVYLATHRLESLFQRARRLGCLTPGFLHNDPASPLGAITLRPWGERSFYANDPSGNPLCFVDARTVFTGSPRQIAALRKRRSSPLPRSRTTSRPPPAKRERSRQALQLRAPVIARPPPVLDPRRRSDHGTAARATAGSGPDHRGWDHKS